MKRKDFAKRNQSAHPIGLAKKDSDKKQSKVTLKFDTMMDSKYGYDHKQRPSTAFTDLRNKT